MGTPSSYAPNPVQYYTPTHCIDTGHQNGVGMTYTAQRGSSYHGGEFIFQLASIALGEVTLLLNFIE